MSRSCYTDDFGDDFPCQLNLYRANVDRSIASKAGQARLRELRDALTALPEKKLADEVFAPPTGEACALGVWAKRHIPDAETVQTFDGDDNDTAELLKPFKWPRLVVMDLVYANDEPNYIYESHLGPHREPWAYRDPRAWPLERARLETDDERYARVLAWVEERIAVSPSSGAERP
jgi:hypothetical protein